MLKKISYCFTYILIFLLSSCESEYKFTLETPKSTYLNSDITISVKENNNKKVDKIEFYIDGKKFESTKNSLNINTSEIGIGKHSISALVFYPGKTKKINNSFEVMAEKAPDIYSYKIINEYPHDKNAYTQGLEYYNGFLYETTGRRGQSSLRKVDIKTGKVLQKVNLEKEYFGEGMSILNNKIFWLTWEAKKGFVYDLKTLKREKEFNYNNSKEGWGLTNNGSELIKSDGTNKIWFLNAENLTEKRFIEIYTNKYAVDNLNELELINGKLYANKYQQNAIVIIDIKTGEIEGIANLKGLKKEMEKTQELVPQDEVLNGIAYDSKNDRLFVTGKNWGKLFEIKLIKK